MGVGVVVVAVVGCLPGSNLGMLLFATISDPLPSHLPPQEESSRRPLPAARKQSRPTSDSIEKTESSGCGVVWHESEEATEASTRSGEHFEASPGARLWLWPSASLPPPRPT